MEADRQVYAGSRLAALRMFLGMSQSDLAKAIGRGQPTIANYERNTANAAAAAQELHRSLGTQSTFFEGSDIHIPTVGEVTFRKRRSATQRERARARAAVALASGVLAPIITRTLRLPIADIPDLSGEEPETAAILLRSQWNIGLGPIGHMLKLLEAKGVSTYFLNGSSKALDAMCVWHEGRPYVLFSTAKLDGARARFDAAHELGHLILHQGKDHGDADRDDLEREADRFASEFLAPRESFVMECPNVFSVSLMAPLRSRWGMSIQALVRRGRDVGKLTDAQYKDAFRRMSGWGYRSGPEPGCPMREESFIHARLFEVLGDRGKSAADFVGHTGLPTPVVAELMPQINQYLSPVSISELFADDRAPLGLD